jgi:hypothetical protein
MGKRFWSLVLSSALVAGVFAIAPAQAAGTEIKFFLGSTGCSAADVNFDFLTVTDADDAVECNYTGSGIRNEIGSQTGTVGAEGQNAVTDRETATRYFDSIDGGPIALDASRPVTGSLFTMGASCVNATVPCTPVGVSAGNVTLEIELVGYVGEAETVLGAQTDSFQVSPGAPHETKVSIQPDAASSKTYDRIELRTWNHGQSAGHGMIKTTGEFNSSITVPTGGAIISDPGTPSKPKPTKPGKDCGKGKSKGKGKGPKSCPKPGKPKPPKPAPEAPKCAPYVPGDQGKTATTSIVGLEHTADKPLEVKVTTPGGTPDAPESSFQNIQVGAVGADMGLFARYEFPETEDHDIYLNYADGSEAAHAGGFNPFPFVPQNDVQGTDGTGSGGHSEQGAEQIDGVKTPACAGYTLDMQAYLSEGGDMTLKLWLGPVENEPAAPSASRTAADLFFNALKMRNPMSRSADQASGTPAAKKGCTKGKGKKKGCTKPPVACAAYAPGELGTDQPTAIVTDAATAEAPVVQKVTLAPQFDEGIAVALGAAEQSRSIFNVQVDSAAASAGLYVTVSFGPRRDIDLWAYYPDGSEAASSHGFNTVIETNDLPDDADQSNTDSNHAGQTTADSENLVGVITPDCGGYTLELGNYLGEGGDLEVKLWLGEGVTAPRAPGEVPPA